MDESNSDGMEAKEIEENITNKGSLTTAELLEIIQKEDPSYRTERNVINMRPLPDISNIVISPYSKMIQENPDPIQFVLEPCLPVQGIGFIYAATGLGKTLFALNLAYAIAGGGEFLKYSSPLPRKVLYVDGEMPYKQLHSRLMIIKEQQGDLYFDDKLSFITPDKLVPFRVPMIDDSMGQDIYTAILKKEEFEVVIFDNLSMLTSLDENKANEWKVVQDWLLYLRSIGKTIIVIHHSGKDKTGYRGTSRMLDCVDVAISLQPVNSDGLEDEYVPGKQFKIVYSKNRVFGGQDALPYEVSLDRGFWTFKSLEKSEMEKLIELIGLKMSQRDIAKDLTLSLSKVNRLIKKARSLGLLRE